LPKFKYRQQINKSLLNSEYCFLEIKTAWLNGNLWY